MPEIIPNDIPNLQRMCRRLIIERDAALEAAVPRDDGSWLLTSLEHLGADLTDNAMLRRVNAEQEQTIARLTADLRAMRSERHEWHAERMDRAA